MRFYIVRSGSKGNATLISHNKRLILIDMGINKKELLESLEKHGFSFGDIEAVLFTHEHTDHMKGREFFKDISKVYASFGTTKVLKENELEAYKTYDIAGFKITPVEVSHDAYDPLGFVIEADDEKLVYITDTGYIIDETLEYSKNADYYIFESNHDVNMLLATYRPEPLKQRILSDVGHLSNYDSAHYIIQMMGPKTKQIFLAHISLEANTPELALSTYRKIFRKLRKNPDKYQIIATSQFEEVEGGKDED